jgi:hypothetical protein
MQLSKSPSHTWQHGIAFAEGLIAATVRILTLAILTLYLGHSVGAKKGPPPGYRARNARRAVATSSVTSCGPKHDVEWRQAAKKKASLNLLEPPPRTLQRNHAAVQWLLAPFRCP